MASVVGIQKAFVDLALDINTLANPGLAVDQFEQAFEFCRILDFILHLAEDGWDQACTLAEFGQDVDIVGFELIAIVCQQAMTNLDQPQQSWVCPT